MKFLFYKVHFLIGLLLICQILSIKLELNKKKVKSLFKVLKSEAKKHKNKDDGKKDEKPAEGGDKTDGEQKDGAGTSGTIEGKDGLLEGWMTIASDSFISADSHAPETQLKVETGTQRRINLQFEEAQKEGAKTKYDFYFYLKNGYIYYYATKSSEHLIEAIIVKSAGRTSQDACFQVVSFYNFEYTICTDSRQDKLKWMCKTQELIKSTLDAQCTEINPNLNATQTQQTPPNIEVVKLSQKVVYIPKPSRHCNEGWNYVNHGDDWECICSEGLEQSPIDIPKVTQLNSTSPSFLYTKVKSRAAKQPIKHSFDFTIGQIGDVIEKDMKEAQEQMNKVNLDEQVNIPLPGDRNPKDVEKGDLIIVNEKDTIKVKFYKNSGNYEMPKNFGQIMMPNGDIFYATEIHFKTPAEHTIYGVRYDMEMQVIHEGNEQTNPNEQAILCFLFSSKPGSYNKLLDSLNVYDLPNRIDTMKLVTSEVFIPDVFVEVRGDHEKNAFGSMPPFSFFTYNGSLTAPPCTERTTVFVAKDAIPISSVVYGLFKEALNVPESIDFVTGELMHCSNEDRVEDNTRHIQPLNNRIVYYFDHSAFGCGDFKSKVVKNNLVGHYEKRNFIAQDIMFVSGDTPSRFPGSFVVPNSVVTGKEGE